ncbi:aryl hydrocarbon receptor-like [Chiloscyllium plagiosum]|uniref:aryl hydrocarbon receptor-like n=1 Tax=Chiloscyllium plagiosum TaxID=36176 RepID=UPI001CB84556|nr:aryl hydrocarbon receptor-like [Chiloscyllium plagiosum]
MYPGRKRRKPAQRTVKPVLADGVKSNPSKRHRDRLNCELDRLAGLLPFTEDVTSSLDKLSILRLSVSYMRSKTFFRVALKNHSCNKIADGSGNHGNRKVLGLADGVLPEGELLLQALNGFVLVITADGLIFYVSHTIQDYLGFHQTDVMHQSVYELIHTEDQQEIRRNLHWALNPPSISKAGDALTGEKATSTDVICYNPEQLPPEHTSFLERNFVCRFRCLLDNSSGFLALNFQGRLKFLHGQNKKAEDGTPIPPQLALFAVATPLQPPSILEIRTRNMIFRTKHKLDFTPLACDAKGKIVLGYTEAELRARGTGYQFIHAADMLHCAENHVRMIKTGESGLTVFRLLTKDNRWAWVQANARLVYKNGRPDYIIATQRPLVDEEGGEELRKRSLHLPFTFATGEALLYQAACSVPGVPPDPEVAKGRGGRGRRDSAGRAKKGQRNVDPSSLLGAMMCQDESVYICHPAPDPRHPQGSEPIGTAGGDWQWLAGDASEVSQQGVNAGHLDPLLSTLDFLEPPGEDGCLNSELFNALANLGLGADELQLLLFDERTVTLDTDPGHIPPLSDAWTNGEILSYVHHSIVSKNDQELPGAQRPFPTPGFSQAAPASPLTYSRKALGDEAPYPPQHFHRQQHSLQSNNTPITQQQDLLLLTHQSNQALAQCFPVSDGQPQVSQEGPSHQQLKGHLHTHCPFKPKPHQQLPLADSMLSRSPANTQLLDYHRQSAVDQPVEDKLDHLLGYGQGLTSYQQLLSTCPSGITPSTDSHVTGAPCMEFTMNDGTGDDGHYHSFLATSSTYSTFPEKQQAQEIPLCQYQPLNPSSNPFVDLCPEQHTLTVDPYGCFPALRPQDNSQKVDISCHLDSGELAFGCDHPNGSTVPSDRLQPGMGIHQNPSAAGYYLQGHPTGRSAQD